MSITDELRKWVHDYVVNTDEILAIANRIDAAFEAREHHGWIKLPVDANGVPIRVGDILDPPDGCDDYEPLQVMRLTYDGYEDEWFFDGEAIGFCGMVGEHMDVAGWTHHHHATVVEDVLVELLNEYREGECTLTEARLTEYAAKLRMADDGEER